MAPLQTKRTMRIAHACSVVTYLTTSSIHILTLNHQEITSTTFFPSRPQPHSRPPPPPSLPLSFDRKITASRPPTIHLVPLAAAPLQTVKNIRRSTAERRRTDDADVDPDAIKIATARPAARGGVDRDPRPRRAGVGASGAGVGAARDRTTAATVGRAGWGGGGVWRSGEVRMVCSVEGEGVAVLSLLEEARSRAVW